jgi:RNAse (barnase) inhibitor barstar
MLKFRHCILFFFLTLSCFSSLNSIGQESFGAAIESAQSDSEKIRLLLQKGDELFAKDPESSYPLYEQAASLAMAIGQKKELAKSLYYRGLADFESGRYYGAIAWMNHSRMVEGAAIPDKDLDRWIDSAMVLTGQSTRDFDLLWDGLEESIVVPTSSEWLTTSNDTLNRGMNQLKSAFGLYHQGFIDSASIYLDSCRLAEKLFKPNQQLLFYVLNYQINRIYAPCKSLEYAQKIFTSLRVNDMHWLIPSFLRNWKTCGIQCTGFIDLPVEALWCSDSLWKSGVEVEEAELLHVGNWLSKTTDLMSRRELDASAQLLPKKRIPAYIILGSLILIIVVLIILLVRKKNLPQVKPEVPVKVEEAKPIPVVDDSKKDLELKKRETEISRARALIEKQEMEFGIYADELRGVVVNALVQSRQRLDQLAREAGQSFPVEKYMQVGNEINRSVQILRNFSADFEATGSLIENLRNCAETFGLYRIPIQVQVIGTPKKMDSLRERILFRAMRELMSNAVRHSNATEIKLIIHYTDRECELILTDNGQGFDVNKSVQQGSGLQVVVARLTFIRSELDIESKPEGGTRINIKSRIS